MSKKIGEKIKEERIKNKLTQKELAGEFISPNTLSQIENGFSNPSISTLAYLAKKLNRSMDYFLEGPSRNDQMAQIAKELMFEYRENHCFIVLERLEKLKSENPNLFYTEFVKDLYVNCHFKIANEQMKLGKYEEARSYYENLLEYENEFLVHSEITAYELYTKLVDAYTYCQDPVLANQYNQKAKKIIKKMMANKEVQNIYLMMIESNYQEVLESADRVDIALLDEYNLARYYMILGHSYYHSERFLEAIEFLQKSIAFFEEKTYNSLTILMYEDLSKCYTSLDDHDNAVVFMRKARECSEKYHKQKSSCESESDSV